MFKCTVHLSTAGRNCSKAQIRMYQPRPSVQREMSISVWVVLVRSRSELRMVTYLDIPRISFIKAYTFWNARTVR